MLLIVNKDARLMRIRFMTSKKGLTIIELLITVVMAGIVILGIGAVLVHTQRNWENIYEQVNGETTSDAYVAKRAFESVIRSSSVSLRPPALSENGNFIEFYLYENLWSNNIDSYARFYVENGELMLMCGRLDDPEYKEVAGAEAGSIKVSNDTKDAFFNASTSLVGSMPEETDGNGQTISSEAAVEQLAEGAFAELYSYPENKEYSGTATTAYGSKNLSTGKLFGKGQTRKQVLACNIKAVNFSTHGATVRMILTFENDGKTKTVICSAVRHSG